MKPNASTPLRLGVTFRTRCSVNGRLLGVWWRQADGWFDTTHRLRIGVWFCVWEIHWWSKRAWLSIQEDRAADA